jgi:hypothetical protein
MDFFGGIYWDFYLDFYLIYVKGRLTYLDPTDRKCLVLG